jgi:quinol-cytochrome oxidoreductase complex cytochrome b subunit
VIVVLRSGASDVEIAEVVRELEQRGLRGSVVHAEKPMVHITAGPTRLARELLKLEQVDGLIPTSGPRVQREGRHFYPYHFVNWSAWGVVLLGVVVFLAGQWPPGIGSPIDLRHPPAGMDQPWYARAPSAFVALFPASLSWLAWCLVAAVVVSAMALPMLDRSDPASQRSRLPLLVIGVALVAMLLFLSFAQVLA